MSQLNATMLVDYLRYKNEVISLFSDWLVLIILKMFHFLIYHFILLYDLS
jgi:hypothetical protein